MTSHTNTKILLMIATSVLLSACKTAQSIDQPGVGESARIDSALQRAADAAHGKSNSPSLSVAEKNYSRNPDNQDAALDYAAALRKNDNLNRAAIVLGPFAKDDKSSSAVKTEYAAITLAQGQYKEAEKFAQKAIVQDEKNAQAYHYLGIALDAQGVHDKAERAFRKGLELWEGDPTTIMNNLALNLASQEYLDEAAEILQKAMTISPGRTELERNFRIVTALQQSSAGPIPKPAAKPAPVEKL